MFSNKTISVISGNTQLRLEFKNNSISQLLRKIFIPIPNLRSPIKKNIFFSGRDQLDMVIELKVQYSREKL